jgi:DNA polymerase II small subunit
MAETEKLQKLIQTTMAAGYQIDSEAFEFLNTIALTNDPTVIIERALQKIKTLNEKPQFIDRIFLEEAIQIPKTIEETPEQPQEAETSNKADDDESTTPEGTPLFQPYAKEVDADFHVIEDASNKFSSNGTIEDYTNYFQDRFKRLERLLRQRIDVKAATPILEALKSQPKAKLKIICMITEKREAKQNIILTVEDLQANATILVSHNASENLHRKAQMLLPDQVVCLAVMKTRSRLFLAEDIIFPEVGQKLQNRATEPVYAVLTSDLHVGSNKFNKDAFKRFLKWLNGKYGNDKMREIAGHVKYLLAAGDIVDGIGVYPNQVKELVIKDIHKQYTYAAKLIEKIPDYIEVVISPGNHDAPRKALPQPAISNECLSELQQTGRVHSLGDPCMVSAHGVGILMFHGRSLDDIIGTIPGIDHDHPEKAMKLLLQSRHLAPQYGGKTLLSPEDQDHLIIEKAPDIFHAGHIHVLGYCNYRGVTIINSGGWQEQTEYMQKLGLVPTPGKVPVVNLQTSEVSILSFA